MKRMFLSLVLSIPLLVCSQQPVQQISFAQESRPHIFYVEQAELWAKELEKDSLSENAWYNYFRSCRNAQGTLDWRSDFVDESPYLMEGGEVVELMKSYIPGTFTYYYLSYLTQGIGTGNHENLLKAYKMNPDFPGIHSSIISYAESSLDIAMRVKTNKDWFKTNYLSGQMLNYCYNVLVSLDSNAILFTQHDNDTYPAWMLQDALEIRTDVTIINIDFLLLENYRTHIYDQLGIPELVINEVNIDEYHQNWENVLGHIITNYQRDRPIYVGMTLFNHLYEDFEEHLFISGLAFRYSKTTLDLTKHNQRLYEQVFLLDYITQHFTTDANQMNVNYQNANYVNCFISVYNHYLIENLDTEAKRIKELALLIAERTKSTTFIERVKGQFE